MGIYVNEKLFVYPENKPADELARLTAETWRELHKDDATVEPSYDERGRQINRVDRSEVVVVNEPTHTIVQLSDGTVLKTNKTPTPPAPLVDQNPTPQYRFSSDDFARLHSEERTLIQCGGGVGTQASEKVRPDNLWSSRRREP